MTPFHIYIEFSSPLILGRRLNLDGILANLLYERFIAHGIEEEEALKRAHRDIPLTQRDGIFAGSSALVQRCHQQSVTLTGSLERHLTAIPDIEQKLMPNERSRQGQRAFDKVDRRYKNFLTSYTACDFTNYQGIWFIAHGNRDMVQELLDDAHCLGTKRGAGYGQIKSRTYTDMPAAPYHGIMTETGQIVRPIPITVAKAWGMTPLVYRTAQESVRPPYWREHRMQCYVPAVQFWNYDDIAEMLGE